MIKINQINENGNDFPSHSAVLVALLNELHPVNFLVRAGLSQNSKLENKHYIIATSEVILETAIKNNWALCMKDESLHCYNGTYWKSVQKNELKKFLGDAAERLGVDAYIARHYKFKDELYNQFHSSAFLPSPSKESKEVLINLYNGTLVISSTEQYLREFRREDFLTYQLPFAHDPDAEAPLFESYLNKVLPDKDQQKVLLQYVGYSFVKTSELKLEKAMIVFGSGANGKSVFFDVINALLGSDNITNFSLASLTNDSGYQRVKIADKLLNYASEISPKMDSAIFKQLASGEPVEARLPYKEPIIIKDYAKLMFNTNILLKEVEHNYGFYRRFILIHFGVTIPESDRDPQLAQKIIKYELDGVLNLILSALKELLRDKQFSHSDAILKSLEEFKKESDSVYMFMDEEGYVPDNRSYIPLKTIYNNYDYFCECSGFKPCSRNTFSSRLKNLGIEVNRQSQGFVVYVKKNL